MTVSAGRKQKEEGVGRRCGEFCVTGRRIRCGERLLLPGFTPLSDEISRRFARKF